MAEFLFEIFSEEIPARMQKRATEDLARLILEALAKNGIVAQSHTSFVAVRRLGLCINDLPSETPEVREEIKGPKVGAPQQAIDGFLRKSGINDITQARIESDPKKGDFYVVDIIKAGAKTKDILAQILPNIINNFPWPKSMRWGTGNLRWVRPIHSIIALFDGEIVEFEIENIKSGNQTQGHRFHGNGIFEVKDFADYQQKIAAANVMIDREARKIEIMAQAKKICDENNLELIEDIGLLDEVCGLVDKPVVILGQMDESFLDLPPEVIRLTLRVNQKYFVVNSKATGKLAPYFIVISNIEATDGGKAIAHGNARVLAARLNDARYFWDLDCKSSLESRVERLDKIVFHQKIGSIGEKVRRIVALAGEIAPIVGADVNFAKRAALLAKADLVTEMVGEFPELQGIMGRYYANNDAESPDVANAIMEHYKPVGPSDYVPTNPVSIAAALADKFDTLVSFFAIGEKPSGSGDPYALRRAALGAIKINWENKVRFSLKDLIEYSYQKLYQNEKFAYRILTRDGSNKNYFEYPRLWNDFEPYTTNVGDVVWNTNCWEFDKNSDLWIYEKSLISEDDVFKAIGVQLDDSFVSGIESKCIKFESCNGVVQSLLAFFLDRLKVYLRDEGFAHDVIDAVFAKKDDDLVRIVNRIKAVSQFLKTNDGENLLAGYKRASNILKAEEKKGDLGQNLVVETQHLQENAEKALNIALQQNTAVLSDLLAKEQYEDAMKTLSQLREPVYDFLDNVLVNDSDNLKRNNRLALLLNLRQQMALIADFEQIRG
jgi:glycyl-tRNA synthetase beta chain